MKVTKAPNPEFARGSLREWALCQSAVEGPFCGQVVTICTTASPLPRSADSWVGLHTDRLGSESRRAGGTQDPNGEGTLRRAMLTASVAFACASLGRKSPLLLLFSFSTIPTEASRFEVLDKTSLPNF